MARKIGLRFRESMYGRYEILEGPDAGRERRFNFHWEAETGDLLRSLRDGRGEGTGWVEAEGLAGRAGLQGFMVVKPIVARFIRYEFRFTGDDGCLYRFMGQKKIRHLHPARSWTTLHGAIFDDRGKLLAQTLSRFRFRDVPAFLLSFRFPLVRD